MNGRFDPSGFRSPFDALELPPVAGDPLASPVILRERLNIFSFMLSAEYELISTGGVGWDYPQSNHPLIEAQLWIYGLLRAPVGIGYSTDTYQYGQHRGATANAFLISFGDAVVGINSNPSRIAPMSAKEEEAIAAVWATMSREQRRASWSYSREVRERLTPVGHLRLFQVAASDGFDSRALYQLMADRAVLVEGDDPSLIEGMTAPHPAMVEVAR